MNEQVELYIEKYPALVADLFKDLRGLIYESIEAEVEETLWARLPSYYVGESFVRLIPFKDHINVEARAIIKYRAELTGYKITPKGMLQIYTNQQILTEIIKQIFLEALT